MHITTAQPAKLHRRLTSPVALWHLLSLDAPTVAALWTWFIAGSVHIRLPLTSMVAMAVAVWMLYAADRLLDARHLAENPLHTGDLELRHRFHHRHRTGFLCGILAASVTLAILIPRLAPSAIHLYLVLGALLAGYFILIHTMGSAHRLPKELAVGIFFACAVFIPTVARAPDLRAKLLLPAVLFAALCTLNCLFIYRWEHPAPPFAPTSVPEAHLRAHPITRVALRWLHPLTAALALACIAGALATHSPLTLATGVSTLIFLLLDRHPGRLRSTTLRAAADLALLTPLLFLPILR